jgi:predicted RNA binding protein YcfA (HicA-like mRNA interferase family)
MKVRDVLKRLNEEGWYLDRTRGDHRQFKHPDKPGRVTVAGHPRDDVDAGTLKSIAGQAGWEEWN